MEKLLHHVPAAALLRLRSASAAPRCHSEDVEACGSCAVPLHMRCFFPQVLYGVLGVLCEGRQASSSEPQDFPRVTMTQVSKGANRAATRLVIRCCCGERKGSRER